MRAVTGEAAVQEGLRAGLCLPLKVTVEMDRIIVLRSFFFPGKSENLSEASPACSQQISAVLPVMTARTRRAEAAVQRD